MSFILDALKKSETERQQQGPSDFANVPSTPESPGAPRWLWVLVLLLAVNLAVLLGVDGHSLVRDIEPELLRLGLVTITSSGRIATRAGVLASGRA